ncbi:PST family polysaccharide transporter [Lacinutrix venerupis]|uniref:O-antigen translocase n=1 Tax=Lacinutrix venerupis TaxID=1486034 RepID=UPI000EB05670|nr:O-antigen translocase [Lacinutrix venerupis]RLJ67127.1 PST family polysaccharide transporter [Lacinutrix venerupis]
MKFILKYIDNNVLVKVASLNSVSVFIKIISGFLTSKFIAIFVGAEGLALIGNLRDFASAARTFSILGMYNGVVKYVAQFKTNKLELSKILSTTLYLGFIATGLVSIFSYYYSEEINTYLFKEYNDYGYVIRIFAIVLPFYALNMMAFSILNGFSKFKYLILFNIFGQILGAAITIILIWQNQIDGALIAVVIAESMLFLITLVGILNRQNFAPLIKASNFNFGYVKKLSAYSVMALFSAILLPFIAVKIRGYITDELGLQKAGMWEAMNRISKYYLMFISSLLALYILPRFSEINTIKGFRKEVFNFYKTIVPIFALILAVIYLLRNFIIQILFTNEFQPVEELFLWQLLGDFIKVLSMIITYQFLAKKMFWHYIIVEAFSVAVLYLTSIYFIDAFGVVGATIAHFATFVLHYGIVLLIFSSSLFGVLPKNEENDD